MRNSNKTEEWKNNINNYRSSGLSAKAWSELNKTSVNALHYWIKKLKKAESNDEAEQSWISIPLKDQTATHSSVTIKIDDIAIEVTAGFDKNILMDVLSVVRNYDRNNHF